MTLSQMNHNSHISPEDNRHNTEPNAITQSEMIFDPQLETMQDWRSRIPEPINNMVQNRCESPAPPLPTAYPAVSLDDNPQDMPAAASIHTENQTHRAGDPFPTLMGNATSVSPFFTNNLWGTSLMSPGPSWLVGYDFDLEALNTSVSTTVGITEPLFQTQMSRTAMPSVPQLHVIPEAEAHKEQDVANESVRRGWFSHIDLLNEDDHGGVTTGQMTPVTVRDQYEIGDSFRHRVTQRLRARANDEPLPSANFLVCPILYKLTRMGTGN